MAMYTGSSLPSVMKHDFSRVPKVSVPRSAFRRSHGHKTMISADYLYPIFTDEVVPGDTFNMRLASVGRLATLLVPIMDNMYVDYFFFFVPNRLIWEHWADFMGEHDDAGYQDTEYTVPEVVIDTSQGAEAGIGESLADYFGLPTDEDAPGAATTYNVNALHFRAYNLIYNEFFRDQNLIGKVTVDRDDGPDDGADYVLLKRGKRHDYFTSCLPWPQKGIAVDLPLGTTAPVITGSDRTWAATETAFKLWDRTDGTYPGVAGDLGHAAATGVVGTNAAGGSFATEELVPSNLWADLTNATAATINSLREAFQLQKLMEQEARGGTRYVEQIRSLFGVVSPDFRLQRPEYLGGGSKPIMVGAVSSTTQSAAVDLGYLGGVGYHASNDISWSKSFTEHGVIIGLVNLRADLTYQGTGIDRMWSRQDKYDFYFPVLAHLGEQAVLNKEIYFQDAAADDNVFGYQERWSEMRYKRSMITGHLRSVSAASFDHWHLSQDFGALPVLNQTFIEEAVPVDRVIADLTTPDFILDMYFDYVCVRPMPTYSVPGYIDHF